MSSCVGRGQGGDVGADHAKGGRAASSASGSRRLAIARVALTCAVLVAFSALPRPAAAEGIFSEAWTSWRTEHFTVHAHESIADLGPAVVELVERAHALITPMFGFEPAARTHVVLEDRTDDANGFASTVPWNAIRLHAVPPTAESSLGYYDNWMWNLVLHEYTHIVHISRVSGVPDVLNRVTGSENTPNSAVPRWLTEGLAVWFESELTGTGRLNSAYFDSYWRGAALDGTFPQLGDLSGSTIEWPFATGWYLSRGHF